MGELFLVLLRRQEGGSSRNRCHGEEGTGRPWRTCSCGWRDCDEWSSEGERERERERVSESE